jgi:hypothetical protein
LLLATLIAYPCRVVLVPMTVVETPTLLRDSVAQSGSELVFFLAASPEAGDINAGDWRRSKTSLEGTRTGKRGGALAIYCYHDLRQE